MPVIGTFDLRQRLRPMVDNISVFVGYRCNPHTDIRERRRRPLRELLGGTRDGDGEFPSFATDLALTAAGPYADVMNYGLTGRQVMNVSHGRFSWRQPQNGLTDRRRDRSGAGRRWRSNLRPRLGHARRFKRRMTPL